MPSLKGPGVDRGVGVGRAAGLGVGWEIGLGGSAIGTGVTAAVGVATTCVTVGAAVTGGIVILSTAVGCVAGPALHAATVRAMRAMSAARGLDMAGSPPGAGRTRWPYRHPAVLQPCTSPAQPVRPGRVREGGVPPTPAPHRAWPRGRASGRPGAHRRAGRYLHCLSEGRSSGKGWQLDGRRRRGLVTGGRLGSGRRPGRGGPDRWSGQDDRPSDDAHGEAEPRREASQSGWPSVGRAGVTMTGDASDVAGPMDGSLRLPITVTGLKPGETIELAATGAYVVKWICGTEPPPCGELGCAPAFLEEGHGSARSTSTVVGGEDGLAAIEVELAAQPPSESCPADSTAPWRTQWEQWTKVRVTDGVHGLRLTPGALDYGETN